MRMEMTRRLALKLMSAGALGLGLVGPVLAQDTVDKITWGMGGIPETLFIPDAWSTGNGVIMSLVQEGPLAFGVDLSVIPGVASQAFPDPTTIIYTLRDDVTFSDGTPLTPADIVATYEFQRDHANNGSQVGFFFDPIDTITATGDHEVTIKLKAPNVQFQYAAPHMAGFIFKKDQIEGDRADLGGADDFIIGTGPYKIVEFDPGERVLLEARDDYWNGAPLVKQIEFVKIPDSEAQLLAMQAGQIDGFFNIRLASIDQWEALPNVDIYEAPSASTMLLTLNNGTAPFNDVHVRRAIAYSVDREGLLNAIMKGKGEVLQAINPPEMWAGVMSADEARAFYQTIPTYAFDLDKAKAELALSSVPEGFEFTVPVPNNNADAINVLQNVAQNLATIGVTLKLEQVDPNQWLTQFFQSGAPMQLMTYWPDFADPVNYPDLFANSRNARENGQNQSYYKNPKVDELLNFANEESDPAKRKVALEDAFRIINDEVAVVPIYTPYSAMALNNKLQMTGYNAFWYNIPWAVRGFGPKQ
jgi:peptide/nickel transport system substrate-binding protein